MFNWKSKNRSAEGASSSERGSDLEQATTGLDGSTKTGKGSKPHVEVFATGFTGALRRKPKVGFERLDWKIDSPKTVSIRAASPQVRVQSFTFGATDSETQSTGADVAVANPPVKKQPPIDVPQDTPQDAQKDADASASKTRLTPPSDTVRWADRLYYLLQPPVESWLQSESFEFPFKPFPYQMTGVAFLYPRYAAVLADEMGLGKTMQAVTTIRLLLRTGEINNVLLICPKPLVTNWKREFGLWAPEIPVLIVEGPQNERAWQWNLDTVPVKIANYELVHRDRDLLCDGAKRFDLVALDEAQRIKNRDSSTSKTVRSIERKRSWALTGTPVENSANDLYGIFEFVSPGQLNVTMTPRRMGKAAGEFILRRTKDKVLKDLPPKLFRDPQLSLTRGQLQSYQMAEEKGVMRLTDMGESVTIQHVFELVLRLKQICNFDPATGESAKCERLSADLDEVVASGKKAVIFSQWVKTIKRLSDEFAHLSPLEYHGKIPSRSRDGILDQFRNDPNSNVLLMSYGAGSVGLNLQFCEYVFLFDQWWNPAVEDQAVNRAHRIGAVGPVTVTRFVTANTIEERINEVLENKRVLFETILSEARGSEKLGMSRKDVFGLFNLSVPAKAAA